jgi:hypothetical protein
MTGFILYKNLTKELDVHLTYEIFADRVNNPDWSTVWETHCWKVYVPKYVQEHWNELDVQLKTYIVINSEMLSDKEIWD